MTKDCAKGRKVRKTPDGGKKIRSECAAARKNQRRNLQNFPANATSRPNDENSNKGRHFNRFALPQAGEKIGVEFNRRF